MNRHNQEIFDELRHFYRQHVPGECESVEKVNQVYMPYLAYIGAAIRDLPSQLSLLDLGCGVGWTTFFIAQAGFADVVVGVDLGATFLDERVNSRLSFVSADTLSLPFGPASFDIVSCYQFLEHVPRPRQALNEMVRVLKPGGTLIVAGPNLLSPLVSLKSLVACFLARTPRRYFTQSPDELRSPFGNTLPEIVSIFFRNVMLLFRKAWSPSVEFLLRTPDLRRWAPGDTDACYLLNPIDVRKYLCQGGLRIIKYQDGGRLRLGKLGVLKGGTWVVAVKPAETE